MDHQWADNMSLLYNAIGTEMLIAAGSKSSDLWLYATAGEGWVGPALFTIGENSLEWISQTTTDLGMSVLALWNAEEPDKRWEGMEFEVHGTEFKTRLYYEGDLPPEDIGFEPRYELIRRRFGNFKVIYPPDL